MLERVQGSVFLSLGLTRRALEEMARNPVDLGIPAELCEIVVYTDGGAAFGPCEDAAASWGFVVVLMRGNDHCV